MTCPRCNLREKADGRLYCWPCVEDALDAVKVNCEGRAKVTPYVPFDWTAKGQAKHDRKRPVYRVNRSKRCQP